MFGDRLHVYPILIAVYVPLSFITTYIIAVANDHVEAGFPYISDTGTHPPESCVFGQLLNMGAVLGGVVVYIRYRQIGEHYVEGRMPRKLHILNVVTFIMGLLMALGVSIVGNFQETNVVVVHVIGAFMAFGIGCIYCFIQSYMSFLTSDIPGNRNATRIVRIIFSVLDLIFLQQVMISGQIASQKSKDAFKTTDRWTADIPGYGEHIVSTVSEWLMAFLIVLFMLTYVPEFRQFEMCRPSLTFRVKPGVDNHNVPNSIPIEGEETRGAPA